MSKVARLLVLSALLALPTAQPVQAGCYVDCVRAFNCPVDDYDCGSYASEVCNCQCRGYCP